MYPFQFKLRLNLTKSWCSVNIVLKDCDFKAHLHLPQWSEDSTVDCINAEIGIFLSFCDNATVHCGIRTSVNEPL